MLKEKLRLAFSHDVAEAERQIDAFIYDAKNSGMAEFIALSEKISRHKEAILDTVRYGLSNGCISQPKNQPKVADFFN